MSEMIQSAETMPEDVASILEQYDGDLAKTVTTLEENLHIDLLSRLQRHKEDYPENAKQRQNITSCASNLVQFILNTSTLSPRQAGIWLSQPDLTLCGQSPLDFLFCPALEVHRLTDDEAERLSVLMTKAEDFCDETELRSLS